MATQKPASAPDLEALRDELRGSWGIEFGRVAAVACALAAGPWHSVDGLVRAHGVSHRSVSALVRRLEPWLERDGARVRASGQARHAVRAAFGCGRAGARPPDGAGAAAAAEPELLAAMAAIMAGRPPPSRHLDHVSATPLTAVKRALWLTASYHLDGAAVLCLGDHDLTALALLLVHPELDVTVVDVDERLLAYLARIARERGWSLRPVFADLRFELPRSLAERFDLVFTDPPYTPAGVRLFLERGLASLRPGDLGRVLLCYGFGEQHPSLGFKVQSVLHELRLVTEAVLPGFNRYQGAEAIGATSALYACRPTRRSRPAASGRSRTELRIYTQGRNAEEAAQAALPEATLAAVRAALAGAGTRAPTLVGDGFEALDLPGPPVRRGLGEFLHGLYAAGSERSASGPVAVNLHPDLGGYLVRLLLLAPTDRLLLVAAAGAVRDAGLLDPDTPVGQLVASAWRVEVVTGGLRNRGPAVLAAERAEAPDGPVGEVLRHLVDHRAATLEGAWREGLIAALGRRGVRVTKNQARGAIRSRAFGRWHGRSHLSELPADALAELPAEVARTLAELG
ncbi:MAG TPA: bis-aminopropyl spermidine synthase family protein [Actinomycetes bacterium]